MPPFVTLVWLGSLWFLIVFSSLALEQETDSLSQDTAETLPEEDRLEEESSEQDALLGLSGTPEVEDSFL